MSDIFTKAGAVKLLKSKHIIFYGDSNIRALYKDILWLLNHNGLITEACLKKKLESTFEGDKLVDRSELHKGRDFKEVRNYEKHGIHIEFYFITRCYNSVIENMMNNIKQKKTRAPDVIVMNSLLWDISRWGPNGVTEYKDNLVKLMKLFKASLPSQTLVIWTTSLPISKSCYGGFLVKQVEFLKHTLRFEVMEANMFARHVVVSHGFDVLDVHHYLRMQIHRRTNDGIHWHPLPMRHMTNLLLTHIALSWSHPLPGNFESSVLSLLNGETDREEPVVLPTVPSSLMDVSVSPAQINAVLSPVYRRRLRRLPTRQLNEENQNPNFAPLPHYWMDPHINKPSNFQNFIMPANNDTMHSYYGTPCMSFQTNHVPGPMSFQTNRVPGPMSFQTNHVPGPMNFQTNHVPGPIHGKSKRNRKRYNPYNR